MNQALGENDFGKLPTMGTHPKSGPDYPKNQNYSASQQQQQPVIMQPINWSGGRPSLELEQQIMQSGPGNCGGKGTETPFTTPQQVKSYSLCNVPNGLKYLASIDRLFVRQKKFKFLEAVLSGETINKYTIYDSDGREIFDAKEDADGCMQNDFGPSRPFDMIIKDGTDQEVIHLTRPLGGTCCCLPWYQKSLEVYSPPGNFVGSVEQEGWSFCTPKFRVKDAQGETVLHIKCLSVSCCADFEFSVLSLDKSIEVGIISKQWPGLTRELFKNTDNFSLSFPIDLDIKLKAVMIGTCMLINFLYFKRSNDYNTVVL